MQRATGQTPGVSLPESSQAQSRPGTVALVQLRGQGRLFLCGKPCCEITLHAEPHPLLNTTRMAQTSEKLPNADNFLFEVCAKHH